MLGLGSSVSKSGKAGPTIIRDGLVLKHDYNAGAVQPCSTGAASFNGTSDYIQLPDPFSYSKITVSAWIYLSEETTTASVIYESRDSGDDGFLFYVDISEAIRIKAQGTSVEGTAGLPLNNWVHACFTYDSSAGSSNIKLYENGVLVKTGNRTDSVAITANAKLGGGVSTVSGYWFPGYICNAGVWDEVLTQPQIKSIMLKDYAALSDSEKTNLVSWWNLDETLGGSGGTSVVINNNDNTLGEELITGFTNGTTYSFDTFTSSGKNISAAVETSGDWGGCASNTLNLTEGEVYKCTFNLTYNSGDDTVRVLLANANTGAATSVVDEVYYTNTNGVNEVYFRVKTTDSSSHLQLGTWHSSDVINFSVTDISLKRVSGNTGTLS